MANIFIRVYRLFLSQAGPFRILAVVTNISADGMELGVQY